MKTKKHEISHCIANGSYTELVYSNGKRKLVIMNLKKVTETLDDNNFLRCHHSFLVNSNYIEEVCLELREVRLTSGETIPVSRRKIDVFNTNEKLNEKINT